VSRGTRLPRPDTGPLSVDDALWQLVCGCWHEKAAARPLVDDMLRRLAAMLADDVRTEKT
jgi:hypothetical protein